MVSRMGLRMKKKLYVALIFTLVLATVAALAITAGHQSIHVAGDKGVLYQVSPYSGLLNGSLGGVISAETLKQHGDFGLGTTEGMDGEIIALNGSFYLGRSDGKVYPVNDSDMIPFAAVTYFDADRTVHINGTYNFTQFDAAMSADLPSKELFYAIRIDGLFPYMKFRAVPKQAEPYPTVAEALKNESVFEMHNVKGTLVGIYSPQYSSGIEYAGYHFHFITDDRSIGGHVYDFTINGADVQLDTLPRLYMVLQE